MAATIDIPAAGYRYVPYAFQYSGGVEALDGHQIERVEFARPLPLAAGFAWIERLSGQAGRAARRPSAPANCGRPRSSPSRASSTFNRHYTGTLQRWGVMKNDERQSGGAQQRHPAAAQAGRTELLCVLLRSPCRRRIRILRHRRQRRGRRRPRAVRRAHGPLRRDQPRRDARQGACSCSGGWRSAWPRWARPGPIRTATQVYTVHDLHCASGRGDRASVARRGTA